MTYAKTYNPCDDCPHSFSKNNQESNVCNICEFNQALNLINRLKAENKNCGVTIQNQRQQLKACNEKIKKLEVDNDKLKRLEFQADALNEAYEESKKEAYKEFAERLRQYTLLTQPGDLSVISFHDIDKLLNELGVW